MEVQKKILSTIVSNLDPEKYDIDILEMEHFDKDTNLFLKM